ncbi:DUF3325 domain-containing protein [Comamonas endophytica]|uniref:DUF3325 domain-containing protein n=2 Tax=Comamonas endophytica TaxID=2949090 RepID=A0ABY6G957_9BURK|nr:MULTISPECIES: DUF3325 domain-containing protein [unclassified Acidovorax]MCD2511881.1 DUF3325 domain-containing protein [Acidovorax sp. D4N7]UYG51601.1 DUF3325 domain-containing protein [Acidovorax sp. 5MLIR]
MSAWIAGALALPAFTALSLAMERHQEQVFGRALVLRASVIWRLAGIALLSLSLACCLAAGWSGAVAVTAWLGMLSFAALLTGWMLSYMPRHLLRAACAALALAALAFISRTYGQ